jgi:PAS domain S-box-containing protein
LPQFGFSAEELEEKGRDFILDRFHPDDLAKISSLLQRIQQGPFDERIHENVEYRFLHRDGQYRWFSDSRTLVFDDEGDPVALVGNVHNITRSKLAEQKLRESERRYGNLFEYAPTSLWVQDFSGLKTHFDTLRNNGVDDLEKYFTEHPVEVIKCTDHLKILDINQTTLKMYGVNDKREFFEKTPAFFTSEGIGPFRDQIIALVNGKTSFETESVNRTLSGQPLHVALRWVIPPGYEDTWKRVYVSITNITRRKEAEEALAQTHRKLLEIRESEREHLAKELHDAIGQQLIAMHLSQQALFAANGNQMGDSSKQSMQSLIQQCRQLIRDLRGICHGLYPPTLESLGLPGALQQLANETPMDVSLIVRCNPPTDALRFEPQVEIDLFRIVQEAISNALRHSQADRIEVDLKYDGKLFYLQISDNGNGFDPACPPNLGMGLNTMKERAKVIRGDLRIYSSPRGTNLVLVAPIKPIR